MKDAEMKVVRFNDNDVIATSGLLGISGYGNYNDEDQSLTYKGTTVTYDSGRDAWANLLTNATGKSIGIDITDGTNSGHLSAGNYESDSEDHGWYNGILSGFQLFLS